MKAFQPGLNYVDLVPEMVPMITAECELLHDENLLFTLYEDSDFVSAQGDAQGPPAQPRLVRRRQHSRTQASLMVSIPRSM